MIENDEGEYLGVLKPEDLHIICRLCGNCSDRLIPIFSSEGTEHSLFDKIRDHLPLLEVNEGDDLPSSICCQCVSTLISWHKLYHSCKNVEKRLKYLSKKLRLQEEKKDSSVIEVDILLDNSVQFDNRSEIDYNDTFIDNFTTSEVVDSSLCNTFHSELRTNVDSELGIPVPEIDSIDKQFTPIKVNPDKIQKCFGPVFSSASTTCNELGIECTICKCEIPSGGVSLNNNVICFNCYNAGLYTHSSIKKDHFKQCAICNKTYSRRRSLIIHLRKHSELTCGICNKLCKSLAQLKIHKKAHVRKSVNNTLLFCEVCKKYFKTIKGLTYHRKNICFVNKCYLCGKSFPQNYLLQEHISSQHDDRPKILEKKQLFQTAEYETLMDACPVCNKVVTQLVMPNHMLLHSDEKPFTCDLCGKQFKRKNSLKDHIMLEMGMKNYVCHLCGMKFLKQGYLNKHIRFHKLNNGEFKGFQCEVCSKRFSEKWRLGVHQRAVHKGGEHANCQCNICDLEFAERWMVRKHKYLEHGGEQFEEYVCDVCGKEFYENWMLKLHQRSTHRSGKIRQHCQLCGQRDHVASECVHRKSLMEVQCQLCGESFSNTFQLKVHVNTVHIFDSKSEHDQKEDPTKETVLYLCVRCGKHFMNNIDLKLHEGDLKCGIVSRHECAECGKSYSSRYILSNHLMAHKKASARWSFRCEFCDKDFVTDEALHSHLSVDKICLLCDKVYPCNDQLKNHVFAEHNDGDDNSVVKSADKAFECKLCGKKFARKQAMKNHLFAEMNLRRYVCEFCDKGYNYYSHLKEHIISTHGEKEHVCRYCGKDFPTLKRFRDHVNLHLETKPFSCECGSTFKLSRYLNKHKKHCKASGRLHVTIKKEHAGSSEIKDFFECNKCQVDGTYDDTYVSE